MTARDRNVLMVVGALALDLGMPVEAGVVPLATPDALDGVEAGRVTVAAGLAVEARL